jgi:hypothetical protein
VAFGSTSSELSLATGSGPAPPAAFTSGPFRLDVAGVQVEQIFGSRLEGFARISLLFSWEPRLEPIFLQMPMQDVTGTFAQGQIAAVNPQASPEVRLNIGGATAQLDVQLTRPQREAAKIDQLQGRLVVSVPGKKHKYEFKKFGSGRKQTEKYGDVKVTLEGSRRNGPVYEIRMFVEFTDAQGALESFRGWIVSNQAYLLDASDSRIENVGFQTYAASDNGVGVSYLFQINEDPDSYKLIYESPTSMSRQTINYILKDIPLP